jgi:hypothetical protein
MLCFYPGQLAVASSGDGGRTARLYYGVQTPDDICFADKFPEWEGLGFQVVPVLSKPTEEWNGRTGYVQNVSCCFRSCIFFVPFFSGPAPTFSFANTDT